MSENQIQGAFGIDAILQAQFNRVLSESMGKSDAIRTAIDAEVKEEIARQSKEYNERLAAMEKLIEDKVSGLNIAERLNNMESELKSQIKILEDSWKKFQQDADNGIKRSIQEGLSNLQQMESQLYKVRQGFESIGNICSGLKPNKPMIAPQSK